MRRDGRVVGRVLAALLLLVAVGCRRQPAHSGPWRVLVLEPLDPPPAAEVRAAMINAMMRGADGMTVEVRAVRGATPDLPAKLGVALAAGADLVLTVTAAALAAARPAAPALVFTDLADPEVAGVRGPARLARWLPFLFAPGGPPVTGAYAVSDFGALLAAGEPLLPAPALGTVFAAGDADSVAYRDQLRAFSDRTLQSEPLTKGAAEAVQPLCTGQVGALVLLGDRTTDAVRDELIAAARACRLVVLGTRAEHAAAGAVLTLARDERGAATVAGQRAAALMRGERPQLEQFDRLARARLIVNAQAAEQSGVGLPLTLLEQADEVIGD